jgi:tetratricopeptide (TPR) repeat protein
MVYTYYLIKENNMVRRTTLVAASLLFVAACLSGAPQQNAGSQGPGREVKAERDLSAVLQEVNQREDQRGWELGMYEDIEVMRRILADKLGSLSRASFAGNAEAGLLPGAGVAVADFDEDGKVDLIIANGLGNQQLYKNKGDGTFEAAAGLILAPQGKIHHPTTEAVEGVYLKGQGVVYSVSLPVTARMLSKNPTGAARKPISQWERVRKELRGEKLEANDRPAEPRQDSVVDALWKLLAENGQHFSRLPANEQLTVALTLRMGEDCTRCHMDPHAGGGAVGGGGPGGMMMGSGMDKMGGSMGNMMNMMMGGGAKGMAGPGGAKGMGIMMGGAGKGLGGSDKATDREAAAKALGHLGWSAKDQEPTDSEAQNQALLGDLHMKQGRYKDAATAYKKALELDRQAEKNHKTGASQTVRQQLTAVDLYNKLAQAQFAAGEGDSALQALQQLAEHARQGETVARKAWEQQLTPDPLQPQATGAGAAPNIALPAKLIVSAPKRLLDQAGAGTISLEEFKKRASIQYLTFPNLKLGAAGSGGKSNPEQKP